MNLLEILQKIKLLKKIDFFCQISLENFEKLTLVFKWKDNPTEVEEFKNLLIDLNIIYLNNDDDDELWKYLEINNFKKFLIGILRDDYEQFIHKEIIINSIEKKYDSSLEKTTVTENFDLSLDCDKRLEDIFDREIDRVESMEWLSNSNSEMKDENKIVGEALWKIENNFVEIAIIPEYMNLIYIENFEQLIEFVKGYVWTIYPYFNLEELMYFMNYNVFLYDNKEKIKKLKKCLANWARKNDLILIDENCFSNISFDSEYNYINNQKTHAGSFSCSRLNKIRKAFTQGDYLWS
ncbi:hypothetical protein SSABA_v1c04170 [Spiroplasma sabaudiense Ar-1343]|uniref:Uncharacterized protein n=1 Tax=Spiroplasma sabaudiense Ar-1343 TaxID=1276257 RepID=W6AA10_9MOLU|nr:hypothetical protein [Spiroplasma sabaudiense]AHI53826.1 hypothetical protein SSABA_v1c04170 [Spiroplasma sabaudiense Ar-1343]